MRTTFAALGGRDFRYFFFGQVISLIGTWVQQLALSWIAYRVTGSAFMLSLVTFSYQVPMLLAIPLGGVLADRLNRRKILLWTQAVDMIVAIWLSIIAWQNSFSLWILITASMITGLSGAMEVPTRQAFIKEIIHHQSVLPNAIALNSITFNSARMAGPAVAGIILAVFNESACFIVNAVSYLAAISALLAIRPQTISSHRPVGTLMEALTYLRQFSSARWLIFTVAVTSTCLAPFMTFMSVYAKDIFHGGPGLLSTLISVLGGGTLAAALYLANRESTDDLGAKIIMACLAGGIASIVFAYNRSLTLAFPLLFLSGGGFIIIFTSCNILLQSLVVEHMRGRVMALYTMSFAGMLPLGSLLYGGLALQFGSVRPAFLIAGILSVFWGYILSEASPNFKPIVRH